MKIKNKEEVISGSLTQSFISNSIVAYASRGVVGALNPAVNAMNISQTLRGLLAASPLVSTMLTQIPMSYFIERDGGKKQVILMVGCTLTGMVSLTVLSSYTDITSINSFDWRYAVMLLSGYLIGCGSGNFALLLDSFKWAKKFEHLFHMQSVFSAVVDSTSVTTPLAIYFLANKFGYSVPYGLYSGIIALGGLVALKFLKSPPYAQLRTKFSKEQAKELAIKLGLLPMTIRDYDDVTWRSIFKENWRVFTDRRGLSLNFAIFVALGSFFVTETIFPSILVNGYGMDEAEAIVVSSIANIFTLLARPLASIMTNKWDNASGGTKIHMLGCGLTAAASIPLAVGNLPSWGLYTSVAILNTGFGISVVTPLNIAQVISNPKNEDLEKLNPAIVFGLLATMGIFGGILLPLLLGVIVDETGEHGYQNYFLLIMAMMIVSAVAVPAVAYDAMHEKEESLFKAPVTFFKQIRNRCRRFEYTFSDPGPSDNPGHTFDNTESALELIP